MRGVASDYAAAGPRRVEAISELGTAAIRRIGVHRVVYGTDWWAFSIPGYVDAIPAALKLEEDEVRRLMDNVARYVRR